MDESERGFMAYVDGYTNGPMKRRTPAARPCPHAGGIHSLSVSLDLTLKDQRFQLAQIMVLVNVVWHEVLVKAVSVSDG